MSPASCGHNASPPGRCSLLCSLQIWLGCLSEGLTRRRGRRFCYNHTRDEARRAPKQLRHAQPLYLCTVSSVKNVHILQLGRIYSFFTAFSAPWLFFFLLFCSFFFVNTHKVHSLFLNCLWCSESSQTGQQLPAVTAPRRPRSAASLPPPASPRGGSAPSRGGAGLTLEALPEELLSPGAPSSEYFAPTTPSSRGFSPGEAQNSGVKPKQSTRALKPSPSTKLLPLFCSQKAIILIGSPLAIPPAHASPSFGGKDCSVGEAWGGSPGGSLKSWLQK